MSFERFSRMLNGRVCLNESCSRPLPQGKTSCVRHAFASGREHDDPLASHSDDVVDWWARTVPRRRKLERLQDSAPEELVRDVAQRELAKARIHLALNLVDRSVSHWRTETGSPGWRLPPDGWILERIQKEHPDIGLDAEDHAPSVRGFEGIVRMGDFLDRLARLEHAEHHPPSQPFLPITERRYTDPEAVETLAHQDATNAKLLSGHIAGLRAAKHNNQRGAIRAVFAHPGADTTVPRGTVVFHQITNPVGMTTIYSAEKDTWAFAHHMALKAGDVVRYDHARSATLEAHWLGNLGKTTGAAVGLNSGDPETVLRLELAPSRGLYVGDALSELVESHLAAELEVILPAGTFWKVVAVVDAEHPMRWRAGREDFGRVRTIQMAEIGPGDPDSAHPIRMTATEAELDAIASGASGPAPI